MSLKIRGAGFGALAALTFGLVSCYRNTPPAPTPTPPPPAAVPAKPAATDTGAAGRVGPVTPAVQTPPAAAGPGPKAYKDVITDKAKTSNGVFKVHQVGEKWYYEIPRAMTRREFLMVSRIARTASGIGYGGDENNEDVLRWEQRGNKVYLRQVSYATVADTTQPIAIAVKNSNVEPIVYGFDVAAFGPDSSMVIEVGPFFLNDVALLGLPAAAKTSYQVRRLDATRTFIESIRPFPTNIENRIVLTYDAGAAPANRSSSSLTIEMNHSMVLLPEKPMMPRVMDERVGYFGVSQVDYSRDEPRTITRNYIARWRLEPKDTAAFLRGELVEPIKPIVYYIDPATPVKWRKYLIAGVNDWQKAFEAAGFKNAIYAREAPTPQEDPSFSVDDSRYSVIRYYASNVENARGPHVSDPRSGEILETHIYWYHNVMNLLRNWYLIQTAAINPKARSIDFEDEVMGELIRFVSSHEVGHTLGLPHNMKASSSYVVDSLRSPTFTQKYNTSPSIMDYARFDYVAQPGDGNVSLHPGIGPYDLYSISWGYRPIIAAKTPDAEKATLDKWIKDKEGNPMYRFGDPSGTDPGSQTEDLGDDGVKASNYGIMNLKRIMPELIVWSKKPGADYAQLRELYGQVLSQFQLYMGHVTTIIGGVDWTRKNVDQAGSAYTSISRDRQKGAMKFIAEQALQTPTWMLNKEIFDRVGIVGSSERIKNLMTSTLLGVLNPARMTRLTEADALGYNTYSLPEFLGDVRNAVWTELSTGKAPDVYRRNLQRAWTDRMGTLLSDPPPAAGVAPAITSTTSQSDTRTMARSELVLMYGKVNAAASKGDAVTRAHYAELAARMKAFLEPK